MTAPAPLVPPDVDLRDLDGFMFNVERLLASELWALTRHCPEALRGAVGLWCRAWKQVPAASLPDDDAVLAAFADMPPARFAKLRGLVMRGFVLCADGRYYHKVLAPEALRAWERKVAYLARRDAERKRLAEWREKREVKRDEKRDVKRVSEHVSKRRGETPVETDGETRFVRSNTGQGQVQDSLSSDGDKSPSGVPPSVGIDPGADPGPIPDFLDRRKTPQPQAQPAPTATAPPDAAAPGELKTRIWGECLNWLATATGKRRDTLRSMVGKWVKAHGDPRVLEVFLAAQREAPIEPVGWIASALKARAASGADAGYDPRDATTWNPNQIAG